MDTTDTPLTNAEWLTRCRGELLSFCRRYVGQSADAEDVVQEVAARLADQGPLENPRPWLFRVARNLCINILRDGAHGGHDVTLHTEAHLASPRTGPRTALARSERNDLLRAALATMPADLAEVLTLRYFEGFGQKEIADVLARPEQRVKSQLEQARREIARKLRHMQGTRP